MQRITELDDLAAFLKVDLSGYDLRRDIDHPGIRLDFAVGQLALAIQRGDRSAALIACRLILKDPHLPYGKLIKSRLARVCRQRIELLTEDEKRDIAGKTSSLLGLEYCPRELEDYCRLVKRMGEHISSQVVENARPINDKARSLVTYLGTLRKIEVEDRE